jgi:hypothetical protein
MVHFPVSGTLYHTNQYARLYLVPGGPGRLERVCLGEDNLLLVYADDRARLWDVKTQEFWRSMTREKAEGLLEHGGWFEAYVLGALDTRLSPPTYFAPASSSQRVQYLNIEPLRGQRSHSRPSMEVRSF